MHRASVLALALLFGVGCQVPPASATPAPTGAQQGGTLRVALPAEVTAFDPWTADAASLMATRQIFETLVDDLTRVFNVGRYLDRIVREAGQLKFAEKHCVYDSLLVPNSLIYPL